MPKLLPTIATKSAKIRDLAAQGVKRAEIARQLGIRYQHVRNVLEQDKARERRAVASNAPDALAEIRSLKVRLGPEGRVVIPAPFREALGLKEGDVLFARRDGEEVHLLTPRAAMRRAQAMVRQFVPEDVSLADELLEDRRREVEREPQNG